MTGKTTKVLIFALMSAILIPLSGISMIEAQSENMQTIGKTNFKSEKSSISIPLDRERLQQINIDISEKDTSPSERQSLQNELDQMGYDLKAWYNENHDPVKEQMAREKQTLLNYILTDKSDKDSYKNLLKSIPITSIGYDYVDNALEVTIDPMQHTTESAQIYAQQIRTIIGSSVDLTISPSPYAELDSCGSRSTFCDEPEGGMQFGVDGWSSSNYCSIGFRATYSGEEGFVTAGHCLEGYDDTDDVLQPSDGTVIGWVEFVEYDSTDSNDHDAGFVGMDDENAEISDNIFGTSNPNSTDEADFAMQVTMSGGTSGVKSGYVVAENVTLFDDEEENYVLTQMVAASYDSAGGDSGAPVITGGVAKLVGIHHGRADGDAAFTRQEIITSELSGLSWGF